MNRADRSPKPLTGRTVLFVLVAFFGVVIGVNLIMMKFAIQSLPGTEVDSAYRASLAYEREIAAARDQSARNWKVDARVRRSADGGATLQVEAADSSGLPMSGLKFQGRFERPTDKRADRPVVLAETGRRHLSRDCGRHRVGTMGPGAGRRRGGAADVPVEEPRAAGLGRHPSCKRRRGIFHTMSGTRARACPHIDLAVEGVSCAGCMSKIERGLSAIPDVTLARVNLTDRRVALEWREGALDPAQFIDRLAELGYKAYPFETERRGSSRGRTVGLSAALSRRRGIRDHERDDAVGAGVVRQCRRHDLRAARFLSLAVGADRAAGRGLCGPAVLPFGLAGAAHPQRQHGRSDQRRRHPRARACRWSKPSITPSTPISTRRSCC